MLPIKCVVIGNSDVGKSSLLGTYINRTFTSSSHNSYDHHLTKATTSDGSKLDLLLCDTLGLKDFDRINRLCYHNTEVFIICFSVVNPDDFYYIRLRWLPEVRNRFPTVPIILVGTKIDLRDHEGSLLSAPITYEKGMQLAHDIGAMVYLECSAMQGIGVSEIFDAAATCGLQNRLKYGTKQKKRRRKRDRCDIV